MTPAAESAAAVTPRPGDHVRGNPDADLVLIEYGDFQCPTCRMAAPAVELVLKQHRDSLLFVFRNYPLESIHPDALSAAEAAEAAGAQNRFWQMHELLFANQQQLSPAALEEYAGTLELDMARFRSDMHAHTHLTKIRLDMRLGDAAHVRATPGFFLDGKPVDVSFGMRALHDSIESALHPRKG